MANHVAVLRKLKDKSFYSKDSEKVHLWVHLLLSANWCDKEELLGGVPIICKPGQFTTGRKQLSKDTGIDESKIERCLTYFEKIEQQIEQRKTSTNRLISICNWSEYQKGEQRNAQRVNNKCTTSEHTIIREEEKKGIIYPLQDINIPETKFQKYEKWLKTHCPNVARLEIQMTEENFNALLSKYDSQLITDKVLAMENKKDLNKKYKSVYLTLNTWLKVK